MKPDQKKEKRGYKISLYIIIGAIIGFWGLSGSPLITYAIDYRICTSITSCFLESDTAHAPYSLNDKTVNISGNYGVWSFWSFWDAVWNGYSWLTEGNYLNAGSLTSSISTQPADMAWGNAQPARPLDVSSYPDGNYFAFSSGSGFLFFTMTSGQMTNPSYDLTPNVYDIIMNTPVNGSSYLSPVEFSGTYSNNTKNWDHILIYYDKQVGTGGGVKLVAIPPDQTSGTFQTSIPIDSGDYYLTYRYYNSTNYTFGAWIPDENSHILPFSVVLTLTPPINYETCDTGDLACYLRNALTWAFTAPPETYTQFTALKTELSTKAPFGYITSLLDTLNGVNGTGTPAFTLESVAPINDLIFSPIRAGLVWILYFAFAFMLFLRIRDINI